MVNLQELIKAPPIIFNMSNKRHSFTVLEFAGDKCLKCSRIMSMRSYFIDGELDYSVNRELKRTIICNCGLKVILRNGVVFFNPDRHKRKMLNNGASVANKPSVTNNISA